MSVEDVRRNYSAVGSRIIEAMYSTDYLSIGGVASTEELARAAGIGPDDRVLDVGSGLGGPALHLASTVGCRVEGLDVVDRNVAEATRRAEDRGLADVATFTEGDATTMPYDDAAFDVVWGQDAWCHVVDKSALIAEVARVLAPGGRVAFTDWLVTGKLPEGDRDAVLGAAASTEMIDAARYRELLAANGFVDVEEQDLSSRFAEQYRSIYAGLETMESELVDTFGREVYDIVARLNGLIDGAFTSGGLGGGRFLARKG